MLGSYFTFKIYLRFRIYYGSVSEYLEVRILADLKGTVELLTYLITIPALKNPADSLLMY